MEQAKKKKKPIIIAVIVIVIIIAIIAGIVGCSKALSDSISQLSAGMTELIAAERRDITNDISVSGKVESENIVKITSTANSKVMKVYVEIGSEVKEGDTLLEFDSTDLQTQYDNLKKNYDNSEDLTAHTHEINVRNLENAKKDKETALNQAQRAIESAENALNKAKQKRDDLRNQYNSLLDQLNRGDFNDDPIAYETQKAKLESLDQQYEAMDEQIPGYESNVQSARDAYSNTEHSCDMQIQSYQDILDNEQYSGSDTTSNELKKLEDAIKDCVVKAPKSGIVTSLNVTEGSFPSTDALMTIEDKDALKITVSIAEADILKIQEGQKAIVKTTATGDQEFPATVSRVVNIYNAGQTNLYGQTSGDGYSAEITIDDKESGLLIGMTAKVQIILSEKKDVLTVPYESIKEDDDGQQYVLLAVTDEKTGVSTAKRANIETGMEGTYFTEVVSGDIKEGDKIVMQGDQYNDGDTLLILPNMNDAEGKAEDEASAE